MVRDSPPSASSKNPALGTPRARPRSASAWWSRAGSATNRTRYGSGMADRRYCQTARQMIARADAVSALAAEEFDVVVVGGGITGAGVALDAATRGFSVALVERHDFASGTSSRSSKLVHGG